MAARKKTAAKPAGDEAAVTTAQTVVDGGSGDEVGRWSAERFSIDPRLVEVRDAEAEANTVRPEPRPEPTIDDALMKAREADIKRYNAGK